MPECFVDTNLIEYLLNAGVNHQHCCSKVVGQLKSTFADKFAIGIINKDNSNSDPRFKSLFAAIKHNSEIHSLKMALKYLCENQYSSDSAYLRELFVAH